MRIWDEQYLLGHTGVGMVVIGHVNSDHFGLNGPNVKFTFCPDSKAETTQLCQIRLEQRVYSLGVMSGIDMETLSTIKS